MTLAGMVHALSFSVPKQGWLERTYAPPELSDPAITRTRLADMIAGANRANLLALMKVPEDEK